MTDTAVAPPQTASRPASWPARTGRVRLRLFGGRFCVLASRRSVTVATILAVLTALAVVASLSLGQQVVWPTDVVAALTGRGPDVFVVNELRLPRVLVGLAVGAALGLSGALIQTVARNPLASPDMSRYVFAPMRTV